jgi:hypothetical protein
MQFDIVEIAAWIIVWKSVLRGITRINGERNQRLEKGAVIAEYEELGRAEYSVESDQTLSERDRARKLARQRERQMELQLRYPQYLVAPPASEYRSKAWKADRDESEWNRKEAWGLLWPAIALVTLIFLGKYGLAFLIQWLKGL